MANRINPRSTAGNALQAGINLIVEDLQLEDDDIWDLAIPVEQMETIMRIFMSAIEEAESQKILRHIEWLTTRGYAVHKEKKDD